MLKRVQKLLVISSIILLCACGGGGDGNDTSQPPPSGDVGSNTTIKFSVAVSEVDVRRISNGDEVIVDTTNTNSGELTFNQ